MIEALGALTEHSVECRRDLDPRSLEHDLGECLTRLRALLDTLDAGELAERWSTRLRNAGVHAAGDESS